MHINLGDNDGTAMVVTWITQTTSTGTVHYGTSASSLSSSGRPSHCYLSLYCQRRRDHNAMYAVKQQAAAKPYTFRSLYESTDYTSGLIHHVNVSGLSSDTVYYYTCGDDQAGTSQVFSFQTPPALGSTAKPCVCSSDMAVAASALLTLAVAASALWTRHFGCHTAWLST